MITFDKIYYKSIKDDNLNFVKSARGKSTELILCLDKQGVLLGEIKWNNDMKKHWFVYNEKHYRKITLTDEQANTIKNLMNIINIEYDRRFHDVRNKSNNTQ